MRWLVVVLLVLTVATTFATDQDGPWLTGQFLVATEQLTSPPFARTVIYLILHDAGGAMGLLSTAGGLLFGNDGGANFVAYEPTTGRPLWHAGLGVNTSNGPQTYLLDGRQYIVVGAGDSLYAFALQP